MFGQRAAKAALYATARLERAIDRPAPGIDSHDVRGLLLWTMNSLGDVLRATPAIQALREQFSNARITAVAAGRAAPILRENPAIDRLHEIPRHRSYRDHRPVLHELARERYDLGVLLEVSAHWARLESLYLWRLGVPRWVCFDLGGPVSRRATAVPLGVSGSWVDQFNRLARAAGAAAPGRQTRLFLSAQELLSVDVLLQQAGVTRHEPFFLVHPGGNTLAVSRQWPAARYAQLIEALRRRYPLPIVVTGVESERGILEAIRRHTRTPLIDLVGKLSMREMAAVVARAGLCIVNDTGPLHVAQALGRPTVAILGPTAPQVVGIAPTTTAVRLDLPCSPCARHTDWRACSNHKTFQCLTDLSPADVLAAVERRLTPVPLRIVRERKEARVA